MLFEFTVNIFDSGSANKEYPYGMMKTEYGIVQGEDFADAAREISDFYGDELCDLSISEWGEAGLDKVYIFDDKVNESIFFKGLKNVKLKERKVYYGEKEE
jgi:hypothetical protein